MIKIWSSKKIVLLGILVLALILRFWKLGEVPPSLTWDEAAWGYNAYSLGFDGRDEFGRFLPLDYLESFGDFKPPLYAYLSILPVKIFGLNAFGVRFASAFLGVLTVGATYFLTKELLSDAKFQNPNVKSIPKSKCQILQGVDSAALTATVLLAVSPWHINLSRAAFEANAAQFFIVAGVWLFLKTVNALKKNPALMFSAVFFVLSLYTFNTARVVTPLLVLLLTVGFWKQLLKAKKQVILAGLLGCLLVLPWLRFMLAPQSRLRFREVNIFSDAGVIERLNQQSVNDNGVWWSRMIHNRRLAYGVEFARHYFDHFNPRFLFVKGDGNPKFSTQDIGQLYFVELPFLVLGILYLFQWRPGYWWILPVWLLAGIIPAATAKETPHALRIETTLPVWQILTAYGYAATVSKFRSSRQKLGHLGSQAKPRLKNQGYPINVIFGSLLLASVVYYLHGYYAHYPYEYSGEWQYGYKQAVEYVKDVETRYDKVVATDHLGRPYIYFLFYTKENPEVFRQTAQIEREVLGFVHVNGYGRYVFDKDPGSVKFEGERTLYVDTPENMPEGASMLKTVNLLNDKPVLVVYTL